MASPPLLRLPVEMLRNITDHLHLHDQVRLAMTSRYLRLTLGVPTHSDFLAAEGGEFAISKQLYTCKGCVRFRELHEFADDMRKGARARSGSSAPTRFCLQCGVVRGWYSEGAKIAIYGKSAVLGPICSNLTDRCSSKTLCGSRTLMWRPLQKERPSRYADAYQRERDDGWAYMSRSFTETRHAQEEFGLWLDV
ncbi:hypothetical protein BU23DRAFT_199972 [Bimuria novae-zelandiae CBS 107.79]|uniref:F-box domain-containing protein n=1 Tax=Bimuria novae-zelandiae CBS 107.79 TaxID=1447943 RepID=A0A6A5V2G7_9PLEO|nr:hypothetical protein BU23DRAFT_199972 [Bimuria novae-zelandiae CBS 107.79]